MKQRNGFLSVHFNEAELYRTISSLPRVPVYTRPSSSDCCSCGETSCAPPSPPAASAVEPRPCTPYDPLLPVLLTQQICALIRNAHRRHVSYVLAKLYAHNYYVYVRVYVLCSVRVLKAFELERASVLNGAEDVAMAIQAALTFWKEFSVHKAGVTWK